MKTICKKYNSLHELSAWIQGAPVSGFFENRSLASLTGSKKFTGTENYDEANTLMLHGWREGAKRVAAAMIQGASAGTSERSVLYYSVVGFAPCVPAYLAGRPKSMINRKKIRVPARIITIIFSASIPWKVSTVEVENTAARLFNVIAGLEQSGIRINLWVSFPAKTDTEMFNAAVLVKSASQPLNVLKMCYPVIHPSFLRRQMFAVMERAGLTDPGWSCYGTLCSGKDLDNAISALRIPNAVTLDFTGIQGKTEPEIAKMIIK